MTLVLSPSVSLSNDTGTWRVTIDGQSYSGGQWVPDHDAHAWSVAWAAGVEARKAGTVSAAQLRAAADFWHGAGF